MEESTWLAGLAGYVIGRATAEPAPAPVSLFASDYRREPPVDVFFPELQTLTTAEHAFQYWKPFDPINHPLSIDNSSIGREDMDVYPSVGRAWSGENRAEYLYAIPPGALVHFYRGDISMRRLTFQAGFAGGWLMVRDEPREGWWMSSVVGAHEIADIARAKVSKIRRKRSWEPWGRHAPTPVDKECLAPLGWFAVMGYNPLRELDQDWLVELGFLPPPPPPVTLLPAPSSLGGQFRLASTAPIPGIVSPVPMVTALAEMQLQALLEEFGANGVLGLLANIVATNGTHHLDPQAGDGLSDIARYLHRCAEELVQVTAHL